MKHLRNVSKVYPFRSGKSRSIRDVIKGDCHGHKMLAFEYSFEPIIFTIFKSSEWDIQFHSTQFQVVALRLPGTSPFLQIKSRNPRDGHALRLLLGESETGSLTVPEVLE